MLSYDKLLMEPSDVHAHLGFLAGIGCRRHVVEFGFRTGRSARAFLAGGCLSMTSYDIDPCLPESMELAMDKRFTFIQDDSLHTGRVACDVLFIDSLHKPEHLAAELDRHHAGVMHLIAMHDTATRKFVGLREAVSQFLFRNTQWVLAAEFTHNNGLTVISRA